MTTPVWTKSPTLILSVMLLSLAVSNVLLLRQNLQMRAALSEPTTDILRPGDRVPSFSAAGLHDARVEVNYTGAAPKRVLLYFTPGCRFCRQQFPYWRELITHADRNRFEVLGVAADTEDRAKLEDYLRSFGCGGDSQTPLRVALVSGAVRRAYKLSVTPITLLITNDGTVEKTWDGRWDTNALAEANSFFGLNVPADAGNVRSADAR